MSPEDRIAELEAENAVQRDLIVRFEARIVELERMLAKHSGNSSKPPSTDGTGPRPGRPKPAKRVKGQRRQGKQPGAPGAHLAQTSVPDEVVDHLPEHCAACGDGLGDAVVSGVETRQVFDLPVRRAHVVEHRAHRRQCGCGHHTTAGFPPDATAPACWGPGVRAVGVYLLVRHHLPYARVAEILSDLLGAPVSTGWLAGLTGEAADGLGSFVDGLKDHLSGVPVAHVDETGCRVAGAKQWVHVMSTALVTLLAVHTKRGNAATNEMGVLARFRGVLVHDRWAPYWTYPKLSHQICNAHTVRDLAAVGEVHRYQTWAEQMTALLVDAKHQCDRARHDDHPSLARGDRAKITRRYNMLIAGFFDAHPLPPGGWRKGSYDRDAHNLAVALRDRRHEILRFVTNLTVPFDNNQAERDLRMVKLQQKISGSFRTEHGAQRFVNVRSYIETGRKHDHNPLDLLTQLFNGHPWTLPA